MTPTKMQADFEELREVFWEGCAYCEWDEAEGALVNHCNDCCRKIATAVGDFVRRRPIERKFTSLDKKMMERDRLAGREEMRQACLKVVRAHNLEPNVVTVALMIESAIASLDPKPEQQNG